MVRELKLSSTKLFLIAMLIISIVILSGCVNSTNPSRKTGPKYYQGYESIEMKFLEDSPPYMFYYDSESYSPQENTIPIFVELYNKGSSNSYGALFIHGLDPNIVAVQGYTQGYPGYTGPGRWSSTMFSGYYAGADNYNINVMGVNLGNTMLNLGLANVGGRTIISFSTLGYSDRGSLFSAMGFGDVRNTYSGYSGINTGIGTYSIGAALNPITIGMFSTFGWNEWLKKFQLEGRSSYSPSGGMEVIEFPATILPGTIPPSLEEFRQRVMVTACFDYATHASEMVCIDPEPYSNVKKACRPQTVSLGGGQGAPVAVTTIEQRPGRGRTTFVINIKHNKKNAYDELFDYFSLYKCDPASGQVVKPTDKNVVYVGYVYLSDFDITMSCIPDQVIRLDQAGNGQITCSIEFPPGMATSAYQAPMEIELWYGYSKTIYKDVIIRRI
jgi:hypothetical protein